MQTIDLLLLILVSLGFSKKTFILRWKQVHLIVLPTSYMRRRNKEQRVTKVDNKADIYALGLMFNEMFTGQIPLGAGYKTIASVS